MRTTRSSSSPDAAPRGQAGKATSSHHPTYGTSSDGLVSTGEGTTGIGAPLRAAPAALPIAAQGPAVRLTPALQESILARVENGVPFITAATAAGIANKTAQQWQQMAETGRTAWPDGSPVSQPTLAFLARLAEQIALAEAKFEAAAVENIAATGYMVGKSGIPEWRAHLELLKHAPQYRQRWREYRELHVEQHGSVNHEHRMVQQMSDQDLLEAAPAEWRELVPTPLIEGS